MEKLFKRHKKSAPPSPSERVSSPIPSSPSPLIPPKHHGPPPSVPPKPRDAGSDPPAPRRPPPSRQTRSATVGFAPNVNDPAPPAGMPPQPPTSKPGPPPVPVKPVAFEREKAESSGGEGEVTPAAVVDDYVPPATTWKRGAEAEAIMQLLQMEAMKLAEPKQELRTIEVQRPPTPPPPPDIYVIEVPGEEVPPEEEEKTLDQRLAEELVAILEEKLEWFGSQWEGEGKDKQADARAAMEDHLWKALEKQGVRLEAKLKNLSLVMAEEHFVQLMTLRMEVESKAKKLAKYMTKGANNVLGTTSRRRPSMVTGVDAPPVETQMELTEFAPDLVDMVLGILKVIASLLKPIKQLSYCSAIVATASKKLQDVNLGGTANQITLKAASSSKSNTHIRRYVSANIHRDTERLQILFLQLCNTIDGLDGETMLLLHRKLLDIVANAQAIATALQRASDEMATGKGLALLVRQQASMGDVASSLKGPGKTESQSTNVWYCIPSGGSPPSDKEKGTLEELVWILTSTSNIDNAFLNTFVMTYRSFTTPEVLFHKLLERYEVPKKQRSKPPEDKNQVQLRVCITLKYWIEHRTSDMDENVLAELSEFIDKRLVSEGQGNLSGLLRNALNQALTEEEENESAALKFDPAALSCTLSQTDMFMVTPINDLAEQLTLISWQIYSAINPGELLNQAWNKPKTHHMSPNVRKMINRFNDVSYWVTTMILTQEKLAVRTRVLNKFYKLASLLYEMQNFDGLMGIIAGLQQAANRRLKHSRGGLEADVQAKFQKLDDLMQPKQSWKLYRDHLKQCHPPAIPYMGVYLTDLTFIEDGNPDTRQDGDRQLINFKKREMVFNVIQSIQLYQNVDKGTQYDAFKVKEPLFSYLRELPFFDENQAYNVSLEREARKSEAKDCL